MKKFNYRAKDRNGRRVKGIVDAPTRNEAMLTMRGRKFLDIKLSEVVEKKKKGRLDATITWGPFGKVDGKEILIFTKKLATMVRSGLSILDALVLVQGQTKNVVFREAIGTIVASINQGNSLSASFKIQKRYFDEVFINMIEAGEISGKLDIFLDRIVEGQERMQKIRAGIKSALTYPIVLVTVTLLIMYFMLTKVVPTFTQMYSSMGKKLPGPTQAIVDASDWILNGSNVLKVVGVALFLFATHKMLFKYVYGYKRFICALMLKLPLFGNIIVKSTVARLALLMSNLFAAGIGVAEILKVGTRITPNVIFVEALESITLRVESGVELSVLFADEPVFPIELAQLIKVGEKTGNMDEMLGSIAKYYQEEFELTIEALTTIIEPIMIVFVGAMVGTMVVALYLPIFSAGDAIG